MFVLVLLTRSSKHYYIHLLVSDITDIIEHQKQWTQETNLSFRKKIRRRKKQNLHDETLEVAQPTVEGLPC